MTRTGWLAIVALAALVMGVAARIAWPSARAALDCPAADVRWVEQGGARVAVCLPGTDASGVPAGPALTLGVKLDLNRASEADLALVPGVGRSLARALVEAREARGGFQSWDEVDEVPGIGPAKLEALQAAAELRP